MFGISLLFLITNSPIFSMLDCGVSFVGFPPLLHFSASCDLFTTTSSQSDHQNNFLIIYFNHLNPIISSTIFNHSPHSPQVFDER